MTTGCVGLIPSQRLHTPQTAKGHVFHGRTYSNPAASECCENRQRLEDALPYVAGPFLPRGADSAIPEPQPTIQAPHSKFHPVPTRPVFAPSDGFLLSQPIEVQLLPVPDDEAELIMPGPRTETVYPDLGLPPVPSGPPNE
jgi:hypothetical protein